MISPVSHPAFDANAEQHKREDATEMVADLGGHWHGNHGRALCPSHDDGHELAPAICETPNSWRSIGELTRQIVLNAAAKRCIEGRALSPDVDLTGHTRNSIS